MKKILVIDDEEWLREMIQLALQQRGYEVIEAHGGHDGIEKARKELPDLILCDVNMAKVDGYLTLAALRTEARGKREIAVHLGHVDKVDGYLTLAALRTEARQA